MKFQLFACFTKALILLSFLFSAVDVVAQEAAVARSGITENIAKLSWESLKVLPAIDSPRISWGQDSVVWKLEKAPSFNVGQHLLDSLFVPEKTVIIHLLLLRHVNLIGFNDLSRHTTMPVYEKCDSLVGTYHFYQNIYWIEYTDGRKEVPREVLTFLTQYWNIGYHPLYYSEHLYDGLRGFDLNNDHESRIYRKRLRDEMALGASCAAQATNNTSDIRLSQFENLFGKQHTSADGRRLFTKLGTDYLVDTFNWEVYKELDVEDDWYSFPEIDTVVNAYEFYFPNDGIRLQFVEIEGLKRITLYPGYKGQFPVPIGEPLSYDRFIELVGDWIYNKKDNCSIQKNGLSLRLYFRKYEQYDQYYGDRTFEEIYETSYIEICPAPK